MQNILINTHSLCQVLGRWESLNYQKLMLPRKPEKETKMVRSVTINRESWCIDGLRFNIVLQPFLNKNCPTTQSLSCRGLVTVMAKKGIAPPKT